MARRARVTVRRARLDEKPVLRRLLELYQYDLSRVDARVVDEHGEYGYHYLDHYWRERDRHPYLIRVGGALAGFALVNRYSPLDEPAWWMAEFFILAPYRRRHVGQTAAVWVFARHPGLWHVGELAKNRDAQKFWRAVIRRYSRGRYQEVRVRDGRWRGPIQTFTARPAARQ